MRVIQDSDDEFEEDLEAKVPPSNTDSASAKCISSTKDDSPGAGTGSTGQLNFNFTSNSTAKRAPESLRRAFAAAHQEEPQSSLNPSGHNMKQKANSDLNEHLELPATLLDQDANVHQPGFGSMQGIQSQSGMETIYAELKSLSQGVLQAQALAQAFEPSSTVPNATYTQQMILEGVKAPMLLGSESDGPRFQPPAEDPIPWSQLMKFTPNENAERSSSQQQLEASHPEIDGQQLNTSQPLPHVSATTRDRKNSTVPTRSSPLRESLPRETIAVEPRRPSVEPLSSQDIGIPIASSSSKRPRQAGTGRTEDQEDDLAAIGLPQETYKPRPSRSRSHKAQMETPIDYSVRPEKAARASKRRRTTEVLGSPSSHEHETPTVTPRRMQKICEMGFTPTTTTIALRQHNGDVTRTVEWLLNNPTSEDELAAMSQPPKKKKRTTAGKGIMPSDKAQELGLDMAAGDQAQDILEVHNSAELPDPSEITKSPNVQVVIPAKSPKNHTSPDHNKVLRRSSQQQTKRRKTSSNIQDDTSGIQNNQKASLSIIQEPIKEKKRGRGRPKKAESTTVTTHEPTITTEDIITPTHREILHETEPNDKIPVMDSINDYDSIKEGGSQQEVAPIKPPYPPSPKPPSASENTTNAKSTKQPSCSPATTGKVPHRVGLSKRARIAPLLKITLKK